MTEKTKVLKTIENGIIRYKHVEINAEDIIVEKDLEIKNLKTLIDSLREQITHLVEENLRYQLLKSGPVDEADSYNIYK